MEPINQQPAGQPAAAPQVGQPAAEPQKAANLNQAVERAAESANQAPKQEQGQPEDWEWDGNPNNLPPQFAKYGKGMQRYFTKRSMSEAEIRKAGEEYQKLSQSEDWKAYQAYRQTLNNPQIRSEVKQDNLPKQTIITKEEYEEALLDGTGAKFAAIVEKVADAKIRSAEEKYGSTVLQLQQANNQATWNAALSDFADVHPEAVEYHSMGLMVPFVQEERRSGKHQSYESVLDAALQRADKTVQAIRAQELARSQGRVQEKKDAVINTGTSTGDFTVVEAAKDEAFNKAFEFAAQNKKVKVRSKR